MSCKANNIFYKIIQIDIKNELLNKYIKRMLVKTK